jgi:hypothetical protein
MSSEKAGPTLTQNIFSITIYATIQLHTKEIIGEN